MAPKTSPSWAFRYGQGIPLRCQVLGLGPGFSHRYCESDLTPSQCLRVCSGEAKLLGSS